VGKAEKILERMRRTGAGWKPAHFRTLLTGFGFDAIDAAKHTKYRHPSYPQLWIMIPRADPLSKEYAKDAIGLVDKLAELEETPDGGSGQ
jgi:hypothetical protein